MCENTFGGHLILAIWNNTEELNFLLMANLGSIVMHVDRLYTEGHGPFKLCPLATFKYFVVYFFSIELNYLSAVIKLG